MCNCLNVAVLDTGEYWLSFNAFLSLFFSTFPHSVFATCLLLSMYVTFHPIRTYPPQHSFCSLLNNHAIQVHQREPSLLDYCDRPAFQVCCILQHVLCTLDPS